jgi:SAM-dependent methyltransferase
MSATALKPQSTDSVPDIDALYRPTHDERARQDFVSVLRNFAKRDLRDEMENRYEARALPAFEKQHGHAPCSGREVEQSMEKDVFYRFYSSIRYNSQEMMYLYSMEPVERELPNMIDLARQIAAAPPCGGSLRLDPALEIPRYVTALDIHLAPGCFHSEYLPDDVAQGVLLAHGGGVAVGANVHRNRDPGGVGRSIGYWLTQKYPDFRPRRVLDIGTQSGKNLLPYLDYYPGIDAHAVDVSATTLRYGHAKAEAVGKVVHFSQQNAEYLDYPDAHFDLIVSSFFFHELPIAATKRILAQCRRLLRPGGVMAHMELPPQNQCDPFLNFYWDWDVKNNNEPFYAQFRSQDFDELLAEAGFAPDNCYTVTVPDYGTFNMDDYPKVVAGEMTAPLHGRGGWFIFGASVD